MNGEIATQDRDLVGFLSKMGSEAIAQETEERIVEVIQVIGLELASEHFIVDILNVSEIVRFEELEITRVPDSHSYVSGVINLRGKVVPVVDLEKLTKVYRGILTRYFG